MLALRDTILSHPHASLVALFVGAFTAFALTGSSDELNRKKKKRKKPRSLFKQVVSFFLHDEMDDCRTRSRLHTSPKETKSGFMVLLEEDSTVEHIFVRPSPMQLESEVSFEVVIQQLQLELKEEREARMRLHDSVKREQSLRMEVEEAMRMVEEALKLEKQKTKKLKKRVSKTKLAEQRLREEQVKTRDLEIRLSVEKARGDRLEYEAAKLRGGVPHLNGTRDGGGRSDGDDEKEETEGNNHQSNIRATLSNSGGKKKILTIM